MTLYKKITFFVVTISVANRRPQSMKELFVCRTNKVLFQEDTVRVSLSRRGSRHILFIRQCSTGPVVFHEYRIRTTYIDNNIKISQNLSQIKVVCAKIWPTKIYKDTKIGTSPIELKIWNFVRTELPCKNNKQI